MWEDIVVNIPETCPACGAQKLQEEHTFCGCGTGGSYKVVRYYVSRKFVCGASIWESQKTAGINKGGNDVGVNSGCVQRMCDALTGALLAKKREEGKQ